MSPTDPEEVSRIITSLKSNIGHGGTSSKLLKTLEPALCEPISVLINESLETGDVPSNTNIAKIIPIYKYKEKTEMENYRPISLLPSISKILEKMSIKEYIVSVKLRTYSMVFDRNTLLLTQSPISLPMLWPHLKVT